MTVSSHQPATLEDFERALLGTNPFVRGRVSEPSRSDVDVPAIHGVEFARLKRWVDHAKLSGDATGILLLGGAGVGKSHILSRLWRWALAHDVDYVFLHNVLASPDRMARYVTSAIVSALANSREGLAKSRLVALVAGALSFPVAQIGRAAGPATIREELEQVCRRGGDGTVIKVLAQLLHAATLASVGDDADSARARAALAWLSCDSLEPEQAMSLGLAPDGDDTSIEDDARAEEVLCALFDLCRAAGRAFVLCVDQVDNLDDERVRALTSFFHVLLDHSRSFILVTSGVNTSMLDFKSRNVISTAAWDRVAQYRIDLGPVAPQQAREIVAARCQGFLQGFNDLALPSRGRPLFPLSETFAENTFDTQIELRPRDVIRYARDEWEALQTLLERERVRGWLSNMEERPNGEQHHPEVTLEQAIDGAVRGRVRQAVDQRRLNPGTLPPNEDNLQSLTAELLARCVGYSGYSVRKIHRPLPTKSAVRGYDIEVLEQDAQHHDVRTGCVFIATQNAHRTTARLRKILSDEAPPHHVLVITDEQRCPLHVGAKGREYFGRLDQTPGFMHIKLDFAAYAHLDALYTTISDARVGDLEMEYPRGTVRFISEEECVESLHRTGLFKEHPLLHELLTQEPPTPTPTSRILFQPEYLGGVILSQVTWRIGMDVEEVTRWVLQERNMHESKFQSVLSALVEAADFLHGEGKIDATPTEGGGRYIQFLRG